MTEIKTSAIVWLLLLCSAHAGELYIVPFDVDPPLQIDGDLADWESVPNALTLDSEAHATWRRREWTGSEDLSATVRVAWRHDGLTLAADVTDDVMQQPYGGVDMWKGDYINVLLDLQPALQTGEGLYQLGISPGNFETEPAAVFIFQPQGLSTEGTKAASRRTARGYIVEAFVPFKALGVAGVKQNQYAIFEIGVSDSDASPSAQQTMLTIGTQTWTGARDRLLPLVFGDGNAQATPPTKTVTLAESFELDKSERRTLTVNAHRPDVAHGQFLFFKAVVKEPRVIGYCDLAIQVLVNDKPVDIDRLSNRGNMATILDGRVLTIAKGHGLLMLARSPDFTAVDQDPNYALADGGSAAEYELYLGGLLKEGENTITLVNNRGFDEDYLVVCADVEYRTRPSTPGSRLFKPAPTGELPVIVPRTAFPKTYTHPNSTGAVVEFMVEGHRYRTESRFSTPDGQWVTGNNRFFRHRRDVITRDEWLIVRDTFVNLTGENLPLMQHHSVQVTEDATGVWLAGAKMPTGSGKHFDGGANPSVYVATESSGVGLLALNDEFRVHATLIAHQGSITLHDPYFYLAPGATYTSEFAIVPVTDPDYYAFVNAARRILDVNFTLDVNFAFVFKPVYGWDDQTFRNFVTNKSATYLVQSNDEVRNRNGHYARCTDWLAGPHTPYADFLARLRRLYPDKSVKAGIYFDCFLDTTEENKQRFAGDRALDVDGQHILYGQGSYSYLSMYVPTLEKGRWGEEIANVLDVILDELQFDGVYWDEFTHSAAFFVYSHLDGCTADIDPKTHQIRRLKGAIPLLSREYRAEMVRRIRDKGAMLVINGAPCTRTLGRFKITAFTETGSISHCRKMQLYCPMALGDNLTERSEQDAFRVMRNALDYGCLYAWYGVNFPVPYKTLTEHMYPFTPIEIHSGYVIGKERIISARSGLFGWDDHSDFTAYDYDRDGRATDRYPVQKVRRDGNTYAELRMPEGYAATIVRKVSE